jgi:UDP-glucose 4-epimerase
MSSVLVTGGTGVVGSWVTRQLLNRGGRVVTYSRNPDITLIRDIAERVNIVTGDVMDLPSLVHTIQHYGVERIIHMSALLIPHLEANPFMGYRVNVDGTMNVLEAAKLMDIRRVVFVSSKSVYAIPRGECGHPTYKPIDEDYPKEPPQVYGATKLFGEHMGLSYNRIYGLDFIALRFASLYGPGRQVRHGAVALTSRIIESAMLRQPLEIPKGGDQINDWLYHKDAANGVVLACFAGDLEHRIFHLGTGKGETLGHMVEIVDRLFGGIPIKIGPGLEMIPWRSYCVFNIDRARRELGYSPQYDLEAGVRDYIEEMERLGISPAVLP